MAKIFFLMWVSGAGKTTVLQTSWILSDPNFSYVQSYTTRWLRKWEVNGEKYHHITHYDFTTSIDRGEFLERATVHKDYLYGTKYEDIVWPLANWVNTIKEIEIYGLMDIQDDEKIPGLYTTVFLDIPAEVMKERICSRWAVSDDELLKRLESANLERTEAKKRCDYIIDASQALCVVVKEFLAIVHS